MGTHPCLNKGADPTKFSAYVYCGQTAAWIKMPLGTEVGLSPDDIVIVLDGDPAPPPQKGGEAPPQFSAHVYCDQTAGWIKMALSMQVRLGPGHIVLDGDPASLPKKGGRSLPNIPPIFIVAKRLDASRYQDATWYGDRPRPTRHCVRWVPAPPPLKGHSPPPIFG